MGMVFSAVNRFFDLLFLPFRGFNPLYNLLAISILTGILMLLIFRYASNQEAIKQTKEQIKAHLLAVRLFQDQLGVVLAAQGKLLRCTLVYMKHSLRPLAVMIVPIVLLMVQLEMRLGHRPILPGESVLLTAVLANPESLFEARLRLPSGLSLAAPPVRIPDRNEITWKVQAEETGQYEAQILVREQSFPKQLAVVDSVVRLSSRRLQANLWELVLYPGEPPLEAKAPIEAIEIDYPDRTIHLGLFETHWLIPFFGFSLLAGLALKGVFRTEI